MNDCETKECTRVEEDVIATLKLSKLNVEDLSKPYQTVYFDSEASDQNFTLVQLDKDVLDHLTKGGDIVIRGNENDSAVLCTDDRTYDIKKAHTSNTLLVMPECTILNKNKEKNNENSNDEDDVTLVHRSINGWSHDYFQLKRIHPRVAKIRTLLSENPYQGSEKEAENSGKKKYTLSELMDIIQGSEGEIASALFKTGCCCINGYWRTLDFGYTVDCLGEICNVIDSESWSVKVVPLEQLCEKVNDSGELVPEFIIRHLMAFYGSPVQDDEETCMEIIYELNEEKMCRFFAEMLLKDVGKFNFSEFLDVWKQSTPDGIEPKQEYLRGLALINSDTKPQTIQHFSVTTLPQNAEERFQILFQTKPKWTRDEIVPYVEDLCLEGQTPSALLTKYARGSIQGEKKVYSSRKTMN